MQSMVTKVAYVRRLKYHEPKHHLILRAVHRCAIHHGGQFAVREGVIGLDEGE